MHVNREFVDSLDAAWRDVVAVLAKPRFRNQIHLTLVVEEFLPQRESDYFAHILPLDSKGLLGLIYKDEIQ